MSSCALMVEYESTRGKLNDNYSKADNIIINTQENINNNANDFFYEIFGAEDFNNSNEYEIEDYLNKPVERPDTNPLNWWKVNII